MQNYNTLKNQNFKRQQDIREREEIIRIEEIKKQNEELQNIRLSSIVEAENNKRKVKSVKK